MKTFKISEETIKAIIECINDTEIEDEVTTIDESEFEQDGHLIIVGYEVYGNWKEELEYHDEFAYNNIEDLSHWEFDGARLNGITVYDEDGTQVSFDQSAITSIKKALAA